MNFHCTVINIKFDSDFPCENTSLHETILRSVFLVREVTVNYFCYYHVLIC